jgi:hypothetical protein
MNSISESAPTFISADTIRAFHALVFKFVQTAVHQSIVLMEQEQNLKEVTKVWRVKDSREVIEPQFTMTSNIVLMLVVLFCFVFLFPGPLTPCPKSTGNHGAYASRGAV